MQEIQNQEMKNQGHKIQSLSKILTYISSGLLFILPVMTFFIWLKIEWFSEYFRDTYDSSTFNIKTQAYGMLFSLIPLSIWMYGILNLRRLFRNYSEGKVFVLENAKFIRNFAWTSIIGGGLSPLFGGIYSVILSMNHADGERFLTVAFGAREIQVILLGLVFVVIAHVMEEAHEISEENNQFI